MALTDKLTAIANAIRSKTGKTGTLTLEQMASEVSNISTGLDDSELAATTATSSDVLSGKTFYSGDKTVKTGTMIKGATGTFSCSLYAPYGSANINIGFKPSVLLMYGYNSGLNGVYVVKIVNGTKSILASFRPGVTSNWGDKYTITLTNTGFTATGTDTAYGESTSFTYVAY